MLHDYNSFGCLEVILLLHGLFTKPQQFKRTQMSQMKFQPENYSGQFKFNKMNTLLIHVICTHAFHFQVHGLQHRQEAAQKSLE